MRTKRNVTFDQIEEARRQVSNLESKLLRERGWEFTSKTPRPCYWLWVKVIGGKRYAVTTQLALSIELAAEE